MNRNQKIVGAVAVIIASSLWGLDGVVFTPRLYNLDVGFVVFVLHLVPFIIMNFFFYKRYSLLKKFTKSDLITFILLALFGGALGTMAIVKALFLVNFKSLSIVVLLQKLQPVFAMSLAAVLLKEKIRNRFLLWAGLAVFASYFLTFGFHLPDMKSGSNTIYAAGYSLLAAFSFGTSTVLSKKVLGKFSFTTGTFFRYGFTSIIMLIIVLFMGTFNNYKIVTGENLLYFFIIGITTGSGAIFLYYYGLVRIRAIMATICELFFPVSAIFFDYIVNGKILSPVQWVATVIMIFAIVKLTTQGAVKLKGNEDVNKNVN
jgi:drug/metabolite transporter (DMT)-like permease